MSLVSLARLLSVALVITGVSSLLAPDAIAEGNAAKQNRVVMQVSDNDPLKWNLALNNARNLQTDLGAANVEIEIVVYGPGIGMLKAESVVGNRIGEALGQGVKVAACENTMRGQKLVKADMLNGIGYVPAASSRSCRSSSRGGRTCGRRRSEAREVLERVKGIEPSYAAWEAAVLPLNYTRIDPPRL